jgi:hypothetical protein
MYLGSYYSPPGQNALRHPLLPAAWISISHHTKSCGPMSGCAVFWPGYPCILSRGNLTCMCLYSGSFYPPLVRFPMRSHMLPAAWLSVFPHMISVEPNSHARLVDFGFPAFPTSSRCIPHPATRRLMHFPYGVLCCLHDFQSSPDMMFVKTLHRS